MAKNQTNHAADRDATVARFCVFIPFAISATLPRQRLVYPLNWQYVNLMSNPWLTPLFF